jgi:hypothetical protein
MGSTPQSRIVEAPPRRIWLHELCELLEWYERNLCAAELRDPRGHVVKFGIERFPHLIKLYRKGSQELVPRPTKQALAIKAKTKGNNDFGGYDTERAQTLPWVVPVILRPTRILELMSQPLTGEEKSGDTLYVKEFHPTGRKYRFKILVCRRVGKELLVPVTCHPRDHGRYPKHYRQVWP